MVRGRGFSIRTKLIAIYLISAMPLIGLLGIAFYDRYQTNRQDIINERLDIAQLASSNFRLFVNEAVLSEIAVGGTIIDEELTVGQANTYLSRIAERQAISNLVFMGSDGVVRAASKSETIGQNRSGNPAIRTIMAGRASAVGDLLQIADGPPGFTIASAIERDGLLVGIVSMSVDANKLGDVLGIEVRQGGVNIVDSQGNLIFQSQRTAIPFEQRNWSDEAFVQAALSGRTFTSTGLTFPLDNSLRMGVEIPIQDIGWVTGSFLPVEQAYAPIRQDALWSLFTALFVLVITLILAFTLANRLVGGVLTLRERVGRAPEMGFTERVDIKSDDEIEELAESFNLMQAEIRSSQAVQQRLRSEVEERNRELSSLYTQQKNVATVLQKSLLPSIARRIDLLEIGLDFQSATEAALVGGDFFDFIEISDDRFGILIGDVSGKGIEAATLAATIRSTLRAFAYDEKSPAKVLEKVNRIAIIETPPSIFVTLFYGVFETGTHKLVYANAGHWPPVLFKPFSGLFEELEEGGLPLGSFAIATYADHAIYLKSGSILIAYTDGVVESRVESELFGVSGLKQVIKGHFALPPDGLAKTIIEKAKAFGGGKLNDDAAVIVVKAS